MNRPCLPLVAAAAVFAGLLGACVTPAIAQNYPRLGLYGSIMGDGYPYILAGGALDNAALDKTARYHEVILDVNPITPYRPDVLTGLRARHPGIRALAYVLGHDIWGANDADSLNHYPTRYRHMVRDMNGFLYNRLNGAEYPGANVNLAKRDGNGRYVVAEALADLFKDVIVDSGQWDGIFFDVYCSSLAWTQDATRQIDYVRAGYPTLASFDAGWTAGTDTLANRLRRLAGNNYVLVGNCAVSAHHAVFQGWMRENFPFQSGGTWYDNILTDPRGYFADDRDFRQPPHNYLFSAVTGALGGHYSATNARKVRFGLGSATLGEGYGAFGASDRNARTAPYQTWWYDEYAVDVTNGRSSGSLAHVGWLGAALGPAYQMIWAGTAPDAVSNPSFESSVAQGWTFNVFSPAVATISRDATTAAVGTSSAKVVVTTPSSVDWHCYLASQGTIPLVAGGSYAVTFWAKASATRSLTVLATKAGGGSLASRNVTIEPGWKRYQVILQPTQSGTSALQFFLGQTAGTIWFDDVHFQQGATNLYRRDFQNGSVLVNPASQSLQVPLGSTFRRLLGTIDPIINDGLVVSTVTVGASDALFLLYGSILPDTTPPSSITDARVEP